MFGIGDIAATVFTKAIIFFQGLVLSLLGSLLSWAVGGLAYFLTYQANFFKNIEVVDKTWLIMRDFSNMFFILMLIIISFATIFQIKNYNWKGLMARLIVVALLINFSLVICSYAIRASHVVSNVMLASIGGDEKSIADNLGAALQMNKLVGKGQENVNNSASSLSSVGDNGNLGRTAFDAILSTIMSIVVVFIALLAIVSAFAFSLVRIPVLWALMIVSPLAWTASVLPGTKKMYEMWFKEFVGWTIFLPVYLFTLFLSLIILKARNSISAVVSATPKAGTDAFGGFFGFAFQDLFYYIICILAIVYGLKYAKSFSFGGSSSAAKFFDEKISSKVNQWGRDRTYVTAMKKGWDEKSKEYKDKGYGFGRFRVGGERSERLREARVAPIFGQKVQRNMEGAVLKDWNNEYDDINRQFMEGRITAQQVEDRSRSINSNSAEGFAYRKLAGELQKSVRADFANNVRAYRNNPVMAADYVKHIRDKGKLADIDNTDLIGIATASGGYADMADQIQVRKEIFKHIAATPEAANNRALTDALFARAVDDVFGGATSQEGKEFIENIQAVNAGLVFRYKRSNGTLQPADVGKFWSKTVSNADSIGKQSASVWNDIPEFRQAVFDAIIKRASGKTRNDFVNAIRNSIAANVTNNDNSLRLNAFLLACLSAARSASVGDPPPPLVRLTP